jgi:hypothetical protein
LIAYILRRLAATIPVMLVVAVSVFLLLHLTPGDPAAVLAGDNATSDQVAQIRARLGLDQPLWWQFVNWAGNCCAAIWASPCSGAARCSTSCWNVPSRRSRSRSPPSSSPSCWPSPSGCWQPGRQDR